MITGLALRDAGDRTGSVFRPRRVRRVGVVLPWKTTTIRSIPFSLKIRYFVLIFSPRLACKIYPTSTQKIQCTFKVDIPDMGHLDGGHERDVRLD